MPTSKKPNSLFIMGDDIGWFNPSCYNSGMMGSMREARQHCAPCFSKMANIVEFRMATRRPPCEAQGT
jgi:arylsulfatase A-like enzyme